jgi:putative FmdB family regulatory protein
MPTYEYECAGCGHRLEELQSIKAKPLTMCPICKKRKLRRLISGGAGFIFKGSGFYITDYRSDSYKEAAKKDSAPAATPAKADGGKATGSKVETPAPKSGAPAKSSAKASTGAAG